MISGKKNKTDTSWNSVHLSFTIQCCFLFALTHYFTHFSYSLCPLFCLTYLFLCVAQGCSSSSFFLTASDSCSHLFLLLWASLLKRHTQTQHRSHPTALKLPVVRRMDESSFCSRLHSFLQVLQILFLTGLSVIVVHVLSWNLLWTTSSRLFFFCLFNW